MVGIGLFGPDSRSIPADNVDLVAKEVMPGAFVLEADEA
jgi:hypothetical protein